MDGWISEHTVGLGLTRDAQGSEKVAQRREGSALAHQPGSAAGVSAPTQPDFHFPSSRSKEAPSPPPRGMSEEEEWSSSHGVQPTEHLFIKQINVDIINENSKSREAGL